MEGTTESLFDENWRLILDFIETPEVTGEELTPIVVKIKTSIGRGFIHETLSHNTFLDHDHMD